MSLRRFSRVGSALSLVGLARLGSRCSIERFGAFGSSMSLRAIARVGSQLSISGTDVSDVPMVLYQPFAIQTMVHIGSTFSVYGIVRMGNRLSILSQCHLGSTLSLRSGCRLGASLSVLDMVSLGATLSLRSFSRLGSSMSLLGNVRLGSSLSIFDNICLHTDKVAKFEEWSIGWNAGSSMMQFLKDGVAQPPLTISPTGGQLHGTWTVESIVSASDRTLKREIQPLATTLKKNLGGAQSSQERTASRVLQALNPMRLKGTQGGHSAEKTKEEPRILFEADDVEEVLPELIRPAPGLRETSQASDAGVGKGILYQDFIALLTLAAQERQRRLEEHQVREREENLRIQQQEQFIEMLEKQVNALRGQFRRLRSRNPIPPQDVSEADS